MPNYSILAVDDEPFNLDLIEAAFYQHSEITLYRALSGTEALKLLQRQEFDVILLDISMPHMNGIDVLKEIKSNERLATLPILMVTANTEKENETLSLGASDFITKPYDIDILCIRTLNYAKLNYFTKKIQKQNSDLESLVDERTQKLQDSLTLSKATEFEISARLGKASESRDPETGGHIRRMSYYSQLLAKLYGLDDAESELILYAAPLHDIGKIGIPDAILLKPGKFEEHEFEIMKTHAQLGADMLQTDKEYPVLQAGYTIALEHHEKYDGSGYPQGKRGEDIHLYARIVSISDVFDALSSRRCYKEPMPLQKVLEIMKNDSGKHFDPKLLELFLENLEQFLEIKEKFKD